MQHQEGFFQDVENQKTYYQYWLPKEPARAALMLSHGLAEHSGRYMNLVNHFVPLGYAVYALDHEGHGKSDGVHAYIDRFDDYSETLKLYFDMIREWQPDLPIFLLGHSMGGLVAAMYLLDHQIDLSGAILSAPAVKVPANVSRTTILAGKMLSAWLPRFGILELDADGISRDPQVVQAYISDPLVFTGKTTARLAAEILAAIGRLEDEAGTINLPLLLLQGSADRLVNPTGAPALYEAVSSTDKSLKIYPGLYHEIFNEPERAQVFADVEQWLAAHLPAADS